MTNHPKSIGIILDGNRRWARARGLPEGEGHRAGLARVRELLAWTHALGIETVYLYAFSTENWNRAPAEVTYLMELFTNLFSGPLIDEVTRNNGRIRFLGDRARLPETLCTRMEEVEERTKTGKEYTLAICLSYGGRAEIVAATNHLIKQGTPIESESAFADALWSTGLPDPDLIIRTGGEQRLSNFLTWQSAYSELFFITEHWPDFSREILERILAEYRLRERRHGK